MPIKKKKRERLSAEEFLKEKEINPNGLELFDKTLKKAAKPRGSK